MMSRKTIMVISVAIIVTMVVTLSLIHISEPTRPY